MDSAQSTARAEFLAEVEVFLAEAKWPATRLGQRAVNDYHLVRRLRAGGDVTLTTADKVRAVMAAERARLAAEKAKVAAARAEIPDGAAP